MKAGKKIVTVGEIVYGGSQHVASAVIQINKKFPEILSCINIKYNPQIISKAKTSFDGKLPLKRRSKKYMKEVVSND